MKDTKANFQPFESSEQLKERICRRAYELYEQRGRRDGHDFDDWIVAESEVTGPAVIDFALKGEMQPAS